MSTTGYDSQPYGDLLENMMKSMCLILQLGMITIADTNSIATHVYTISAMH